MDVAEKIQRQYYEENATSYDDMHLAEAEHQVALRYINAFIETLGISSILDVGCGTGRGLKVFLERPQKIKAIGIEPVQALINHATKRNGIGSDSLICGSGEALPFGNQSFDAACEFAVLHHVRNPNNIVREMTRVARKAVFISDANRFGQGSPPSKTIKLILYKCGLWKAANFVITRGKHYKYSEGDGLFYSYSVFDSYPVLAQWADKIILIPTSGEKAASWFHPLLTSGQILLCAIRES